MASSLSAIASTPISAMNGVTARSRLGCISTNINININGVTFFPAGKPMRSSVGLTSLCRRRTNGLVVRADNEQNSMMQKSWSGKPLTHKSFRLILGSSPRLNVTDVEHFVLVINSYSSRGGFFEVGTDADI